MATSGGLTPNELAPSGGLTPSELAPSGVPAAQPAPVQNRAPAVQLTHVLLGGRAPFRAPRERVTVTLAR